MNYDAMNEYSDKDAIQFFRYFKGILFKLSSHTRSHDMQTNPTMDTFDYFTNYKIKIRDRH